MSKSLGNGIDPMDVIDEYGADSLRYFLSTNSTPGQDFRFDETKVRSSWNYLNKVWNVVRFVITTLRFETRYIKDNLNSADFWILNKLKATQDVYNYNFRKLDFGETTRVLYNFLYDDFASIYLEYSKSYSSLKNTKYTLFFVTKTFLQMLYPFAPSIAEELYQTLTGEFSITYEKITQIRYNEGHKNFEIIADILSTSRSIISQLKEHQVPNSIVISNSQYDISSYIDFLSRILKLPVIIENDYISQKTDLVLPVKNTKSFITFKEINTAEILANLNKEKERLESELIRSNNLLSNENFISKANSEKIEKEKEKKNDYQKLLDSILIEISKLN
jgi:valyl-tRNA synthetase